MTEWEYAYVRGHLEMRQVEWTGPDGVSTTVEGTTVLHHLNVVGADRWEAVAVVEHQYTTQNRAVTVLLKRPRS